MVPGPMPGQVLAASRIPWRYGTWPAECRIPPPAAFPKRFRQSVELRSAAAFRCGVCDGQRASPPRWLPWGSQVVALGSLNAATWQRLSVTTWLLLPRGCAGEAWWLLSAPSMQPRGRGSAGPPRVSLATMWLRRGGSTEPVLYNLAMLNVTARHSPREQQEQGTSVLRCRSAGFWMRVPPGSL